MSLWKRATERVTEHAVETAKSNLSDTLANLVPYGVMIFGFFVAAFSGRKPPTPQPFNITINIMNREEDIHGKEH